MSYTFIHANLGPNGARRAATVNQLTKGRTYDLIGCNEIDGSARAAIYKRKDDGWHWWVPGADGFVWHEDVLTIEARTARRIMVGGYQRVGRVKRKRRLGPDRWARVARFRHGGKKVVHIQAHLMAKAFTTHKWRQPLWWASVAALRLYCGVVMRYAGNKGIPVIVALDANTERDFSLGKYLTDVSREIDTFGRRDYDRIFVDNRGGVKVTNLHRVKTNSDHWALACEVHLN